jgi:hypothetical protein
MKLARLLQSANATTDKQKVGVALYYLDVEEDEAPVTGGQIRDILASSRVKVNLDNVSAYPSQIANDGHAVKRNGGYLLTPEGERFFRELCGVGEVNSFREDDFISVEYDDDIFYSSLIDDINRSYHARIYDGTLVLSRKLFESLLIDILRGHYGNQRIRMFFNPDRAEYHSFAKLISKFENNIEDFKHYSLTLDQEFIDLLNDFRVDANTSAHSIEVNISESEIEAKSEDATHIAQILLNVWQKVKIAN